MTKIKLCGLRRREDILAANSALPDFCGFIVEFPKSPRSVTADQLRNLTALLRPEIRAVGVFVNAPEDLVATLLEENVIHMAQLHGSEDEAYIRRLRARTQKPLIQAFALRTAEDGARAQASEADYILLDSGTGGTGIPFDWSLIRGIGRPFFLAGGLNGGNLRQALEEVNPWAVDLSSGLETEGVKDPQKMETAVKIVRSFSPVPEGFARQHSSATQPGSDP